MEPAEQRNELAATFTALFTSLEERIALLELRVKSLEANVDRMSRALVVLESTVGLDLMLAKIIIDR